MPFIQADTILKPMQALTQTVCVTAEEFEHRFAQCQLCDNFDQELSVCKMCGCYMRWKAQLKLAKCPDRKW